MVQASGFKVQGEPNLRFESELSSNTGSNKDGVQRQTATGGSRTVKPHDGVQRQTVTAATQTATPGGQTAKRQDRERSEQTAVCGKKCLRIIQSSILRQESLAWQQHPWI